MSRIQILSPARHGHLRWTRYADYAFAADRNLVGLAAGELGRAALALPLAFIGQGESWSLCALLGLQPGQNLYLGPQGQWLAPYVPAILRAHPFHLGWEGGDASLCVDEGSGLLVSDGTGEAFFAENGDLGPAVRDVWTFLSQTAESILVLERASAVLAQAGVLEPWPISVQGPEGPRALNGLHRIAEAALNALDDAAFAALRRTGVLPVAYAQLLSMGNLPRLGELAQARAQAEAEQRARAEAQATAPMIHLPADNTIDWDWSKIGQ